MITSNDNPSIHGPYESGVFRKEGDGSTGLSDELTRGMFQLVSDSITVVSNDAPLDSSTADLGDLRLLNAEADRIFMLAREQHFEDGYESDFSNQLKLYIFRYGKLAIDVINHYFVAESVNKEVLSESLRVIGRIKHQQTYRDRLWLLEHGLFNASSCIRDGAIIGLSSLNSKDAIRTLQVAIEREKIPELRQDMEQALMNLGG